MSDDSLPLTPEYLDQMHAFSSDLAEEQISLTFDDKLEQRYSLFMNYLHHHRGAPTWLGEFITSSGDDDVLSVQWRKAVAEYAALVRTGQTWTIEMVYDDALRQAWIDVADERKKIDNPFPTVDDIYTPEEKKRLEEIGGPFMGNPARNGYGITEEPAPTDIDKNSSKHRSSHKRKPKP
jgi:hypothetical protein